MVAMVMASDIGRRIVSLRQERDWTQGQLATYANVSRSWLSQVETGDIPNPSGSRLQSVAAALRTSVRYLLTGDDAPPRPPTMDAETALRAALTALPKRIPIQTTITHTSDGGVGHEYLYAQPEWHDRKVSAWRVKGACMEPELYDGDVVVVDEDLPPRQGDLVVFERDGEVLVRRYDLRRGELRANDGSAALDIIDRVGYLPVIAVVRHLR